MKYWLIEKTLMLGKIEGWRRREQQRMRWLDGIIDSVDMSLSSSHVPVVMYGSKSWTIKKAEHQKIDVFKL